MKCTTCESQCTDCAVYQEWLNRWNSMSELDRIQELDRLAATEASR